MPKTSTKEVFITKQESKKKNKKVVQFGYSAKEKKNQDQEDENFKIVLKT